MTQSSHQPTPNPVPPLEIQPTLKLALFIQYLQNNPIETADDCQATINYWDENNLNLLNGADKKEGF
ncbi:hypothetical protein [Gloeothece verrucosa]|uniref:Uncharacterized protein n=1 Tax=Gloeothece verrucosa (strain PCC 7822) TaxID=497965 RepID=E0UE80_GLOV7|nr:hypothetical protein [Gloeothece verrucosa]ADN14205.1 hypothetical protein Cyan7822_2226 [Gloeothece verrucosa PCC 7822]